MKPQTLWAAVAIVFILVTGAVVLVALNKDVTVILTLATLVAIPILTASGAAVYQKLEQVKEQGNGNINKLLEAQQKTQEQLANLAMLLPSLTPQQIDQVKASAAEPTSPSPPPAPDFHDDHTTVQLRTPR